MQTAVFARQSFFLSVLRGSPIDKFVLRGSLPLDECLRLAGHHCTLIGSSNPRHQAESGYLETWEIYLFPLKLACDCKSQGRLGASPDFTEHSSWCKCSQISKRLDYIQSFLNIHSDLFVGRSYKEHLSWFACVVFTHLPVNHLFIPSVSLVIFLKAKCQVSLF